MKPVTRRRRAYPSSASRLAVAVAVVAALGASAGCDETAPRERAEPDRPIVVACAPGLIEPCERACQGGDDKACEQLTATYLRGQAGPGGREKAARLNQGLCESGRRYFCPTFALALMEGDGVPRDVARARKLFETTCGDDPVACSEYGSLYVAGRGVKRDLAVGRFLLELACRHREPQACRELQYLAPAPAASSD